MKLVKAAGAIALACISANAANMIQEEVQVAGVSIESRQISLFDLLYICI